MVYTENDPIPSMMEFAVDMKTTSCESDVRNALNGQPGIKLIDVDLRRQQVLVETILPSGKVHDVLESTGKTVVFRGQGSSKGTENIAAAVAHVTGHSVNGLVRFLQATEDCCIIDGTIDGLAEGKHGLHINEFGDLSQGCKSTGSHFNPTNEKHGNITDTTRHVGDLGNISSNDNNRAMFRIENDRLKVWDIIGRSICIDEREDNFAQDSNTAIACGIIARSAGIFQNVKRVCQCSGKTLWEERQDAKDPFSAQL